LAGVGADPSAVRITARKLQKRGPNKPAKGRQKPTHGAWLSPNSVLLARVAATLHTVVGSKDVTAEIKRFRFIWKYSGLSLQLKAFGMVKPADHDDDGREL